MLGPDGAQPAVAPLPLLKIHQRFQQPHARKIRRKTPVVEYLKLQRRFAHLLHNGHEDPRVAKLQAIADKHIEDYGLLEEGA